MPSYAAALQSIAPVQPLKAEIQFIKSRTMSRAPIPAFAATTARLIGEHDVIPGLDTLHPLAYLFDDARPFMAQHHCTIRLIPVVAEVYIRTADARGDEADQDFVVPWPLHLEGFDFQRAAFLAQYGRLNRVHMPVGILAHRSSPLPSHRAIGRLVPELNRCCFVQVCLNFTPVVIRTSIIMITRVCPVALFTHKNRKLIAEIPIH